MRRPSWSKGTRAPQAARWSRLGAGSRTVVEPEAIIPAIRTHDFTCALAIGSSYSIPASSAPRTVKEEAAVARPHRRPSGAAAPPRGPPAGAGSSRRRRASRRRPAAEPARQEAHQRAGVAHADEPAGRLERGVQARRGSEAVASLLLDAGAERHHRVERRARVLGVEEVAHGHGSSHIAPISAARCGSTCPAAACSRPGAGRPGRSGRRGHSRSTGKPSAPMARTHGRPGRRPRSRRHRAGRMSTPARAPCRGCSPPCRARAPPARRYRGRFGTVRRSSWTGPPAPPQGARACLRARSFQSSTSPASRRRSTSSSSRLKPRISSTMAARFER